MSNKLTKIVYYANVITQCSVFGVLILVLFFWATNQPGQKELNNIFTTLFMFSLLTEVTLERAKNRLLKTELKKLGLSDLFIETTIDIKNLK